MRTYPVSSAVHNNGNLICAVDIQTSGPNPDINDIMQLAFIPLKADYTPNPDLTFFDMRFRPENDNFNHPSTICKKEAWMNSKLHGVEPSAIADLFEVWFNKLKISENKKIILLGHNVILFDIPFLIKWLGPINYNHYFHYAHRDTMTTALYLNDLADWRSQPIPFAKYSLKAVCNRTDVTFEKIGDAKLDALAAADAYRRLLSMQI